MHTVAAPSPIEFPCTREPRGARDYSAFGGVLRSEIDFPELMPTRFAASPDWTVVIDYGEPPALELLFVGERRIREERYQLYHHRSGLRLVYSHAGTFDIAHHGSHITWYYRCGALPELVRSIVLGPAISLALELAGFLCLHGSAAAIADKAVAFVGPKHVGKSTIATALTAAGARLVGDDLLVIRPGPPAMVRPGVSSVRLWADITAALPLDNVCTTLIPGVKTTATGFVEEARAIAPTSLRAIYILSPTRPDAETPPARRVLLAPSEATIALAHQTKLPPSLVGLQGAASQLAAAAAVAATVPVWILHTARDVAKLGRLVRQIIEWSCVE